ncbi:MAG: hypothetical protein ACOC1V_03820 [Candidatus Saliniplasma sp.]
MRREFVKLWAKYVKEHSDRRWLKQQNDFQWIFIIPIHLQNQHFDYFSTETMNT